MLRRMVGLMVIGAAALVLLVIGSVWWIGRAGQSSAVEKWVGQQLTGIAQSYLRPELKIGDLKYIWPKTVVLHNVRLEAMDAGKSVDIAKVATLTLELESVPRSGQPLHIQKLSLERPEIRLVKRAGGGLVGFSDLLKASPAASAATGTTAAANTTSVATNAASASATSAPAAPVPAPAPSTESSARLEDVFAIREFSIANGLLIYDPRQPDRAAMHLDNITTTLHAQDRGNGWYGIDAHVGREPVYTLDVAGQINLDALEIKLDKLQQKIQLSPKNAASLPPELQQLVNTSDLRGTLDCQAQGDWKILDPSTGQGLITLQIQDANMAAGALRVELGSLDGKFTMAEGRGALDCLAVDQGGKLRLGAEVDFRPRGVSRADLALDNIELGNTVRGTETGTSRRGLLSGAIHWEGQLSTAGTASAGHGDLNIRQGRLMEMPIIKDLHKAMKIITGQRSALTDKLDTTFVINGDHADVSRLEINTQYILMRGSGNLRFNGDINLGLNGGPLEKVQSQMGDVGKIFGAITDQVMHYQVAGPLREPKVTVEVGENSALAFGRRAAMMRR